VTTSWRTIVLVLVVAIVGGTVGAVSTRLMSTPPPSSPSASEDDGRREVVIHHWEFAGDGGILPSSTIGSSGDAILVPASEGRPPPATESAPTLSPDEARQIQWDEMMAAHAREPVDAAWARDATYTFSDGIGETADALGATVVSVDCRRTSCSALLRWPNYALAEDSISRLSVAQYEPNCNRSTWLPPPPNRAAPYEGSLLLYGCEGTATD